MRVTRLRRKSFGRTTRECRLFRPLGESLEARLALSSLHPGGHAGSALARTAASHASLMAASGFGTPIQPDQAVAPASVNPALVGSWTATLPFRPPGATNPYVAINVTQLPDGTLIAWGHDYDEFLRTGKAAKGTPSVMVWNSQTNTYEKHNTPWVNLFCSGMAFLPDGRLVVNGGHSPAAVAAKGLEVTYGHAKTAIYDFRTHSWSRGPNMAAGRYYPSTITLNNGELLTAMGDNQFGRPTRVPEVYIDGQGWKKLTGATMRDYTDWYPNIYQLSNGLVYGANPGRQTFFIDPTGKGRYWDGPIMHYRRYEASSVMYAPNKILVLGGNSGHGENGTTITNTAETIDLTQPNAQWKLAAPMKYARQFPNATLLPDGTVLVTGGTSSVANALAGAVKPAELWNPATGQWTTLSSLSEPRLYHSTAILLPDGRVLVAGGGQPESTGEAKGTTHQNMQIFSPPYLFKGNRPVISSAFEQAAYGATVNITSPDATSISRVTLVRLGTVTHSFNMSQRIAEVSFDHVDSQTLALHVPTDANDVPPGYYMLFVLNGQGVPSVSKIVHIGVS
jgi:hypothetical protein